MCSRTERCNVFAPYLCPGVDKQSKFIHTYAGPPPDCLLEIENQVTVRDVLEELQEATGKDVLLGTPLRLFHEKELVRDVVGQQWIALYVPRGELNNVRLLSIPDHKEMDAFVVDRKATLRKFIQESILPPCVRVTSASMLHRCLYSGGVLSRLALEVWDTFEEVFPFTERAVLVLRPHANYSAWHAWNPGTQRLEFCVRRGKPEALTKLQQIGRVALCTQFGSLSIGVTLHTAAGVIHTTLSELRKRASQATQTTVGTCAQSKHIMCVRDGEPRAFLLYHDQMIADATSQDTDSPQVIEAYVCEVIMQKLSISGQSLLHTSVRCHPRMGCTTDRFDDLRPCSTIWEDNALHPRGIPYRLSTIPEHAVEVSPLVLQDGVVRCAAPGALHAASKDGILAHVQRSEGLPYVCAWEEDMPLACRPGVAYRVEQSVVVEGKHIVIGRSEWTCAPLSDRDLRALRREVHKESGTLAMLKCVSKCVHDAYNELSAFFDTFLEDDPAKDDPVSDRPLTLSEAELFLGNVQSFAEQYGTLYQQLRGMNTEGAPTPEVPKLLELAQTIAHQNAGLLRGCERMHTEKYSADIDVLEEGGAPDGSAVRYMIAKSQYIRRSCSFAHKSKQLLLATAGIMRCMQEHLTLLARADPAGAWRSHCVAKGFLHHINHKELRSTSFPDWHRVDTLVYPVDGAHGLLTQYRTLRRHGLPVNPMYARPVEDATPLLQDMLPLRFQLVFPAIQHTVSCVHRVLLVLRTVQRYHGAGYALLRSGATLRTPPVAMVRGEMKLHVVGQPVLDIRKGTPEAIAHDTHEFGKWCLRVAYGIREDVESTELILLAQKLVSTPPTASLEDVVNSRLGTRTGEVTTHPNTHLIYLRCLRDMNALSTLTVDTYTVARGDIVRAFLEDVHWQANVSLEFQIQGEAAEDGGGVARECMELFFTQLAQTESLCARTERQLAIPVANHRDWFSVGSIMGYCLLNDIPVPRVFHPMVYDSLVHHGDILQCAMYYMDHVDSGSAEPIFQYLEGDGGDMDVDDQRNIVVTDTCTDALGPPAAYRALRRGFQHMVPLKLNVPPGIIGRILSGPPTVTYAEVAPYIKYEATHPTHARLEAVLRSWDAAHLGAFLRFCTGSSIPHMTITVRVQTALDCSLLPTAHTCMGVLLLPPYATLEDMAAKWAVALQAQHFGFV